MRWCRSRRGGCWIGTRGLQARQRGFRARVRECGVMAGKFASPEQLELLLLQALQETRPPTAAAVRRRGAGRLPARPDVVGRDGEVESLVAAWLGTPPGPVAVLGAPGIGKSTICLAALHDARVAGRFGAGGGSCAVTAPTSAPGLLSGLAAVLGVTGDGPGGVEEKVLAVLGAGLAVVVLDNFETPWTADPLAVEELLRAVAAIPQVGVAVTCRGTGRPAGVRWRDFAMVSPLPLADARRVFLAVAGAGLAADPRLDGLLSGLDGVPLAVELMGYAAQGQPDLAEVARAVAGGADRDAGADGRGAPGAERGGVGGGLDHRAADDGGGGAAAGPAGRAARRGRPAGPGRAAARRRAGRGGVLRQVGLAYQEGDRLRTLAPVREHVAAAHPPDDADLDRAISHYARLAATEGNLVGRSEGARAVARLQAETGNIAAMLERAAAGRRTGELAGALDGLAEYWRFTGLIQPSLAGLAEQAIMAHGTASQQAQALFALGTLAYYRSDHDGARARFEQALPLYQQAGDVRRRGQLHQGPGRHRPGPVRS